MTGGATLLTRKNGVVVRKRRLTQAGLERQAKANERMSQALALRRTGATYQQIADAVGYASPAGAQQAVMRAVNATPLDGAADVIRLELETLNEIQARLMLAFRQGDIAQADRILRVMQARASYLGLSPEDIGHTIKRQAETNAGLTNNGVIVISGGSSEDYVKQLQAACLAAGEDADAVMDTMLAIEAPRASSTSTRKTVKVRRPRGDAEIEDAVIVDDEI